MEFIAMFKSPKNTQIIAHMGEPGLDMLDILRERFPDISKLPLNNIDIDDTCPLNYNTSKVNLSEEQARQTGLFKGRTEVVIKVPEFFFTQFVDWESWIDWQVPKGILKKLKKPAIRAIKLSQVLNYQHVFDTWQTVGFPLNWEIGKKVLKIAQKSAIKS